jgi:hypothetical protein
VISSASRDYKDPLPPSEPTPSLLSTLSFILSPLCTLFPSTPSPPGPPEAPESHFRPFPVTSSCLTAPARRPVPWQSPRSDSSLLRADLPSLGRPDHCRNLRWPQPSLTIFRPFLFASVWRPSRAAHLAAFPLQASTMPCQHDNSPRLSRPDPYRPPR